MCSPSPKGLSENHRHPVPLWSSIPRAVGSLHPWKCPEGAAQALRAVTQRTGWCEVRSWTPISEVFSNLSDCVIPHLDPSLLLGTFLNRMFPSCSPWESPLSLWKTPHSPGTLGTPYSFNFSTPGGRALAQAGMNKHCRSIWAQTGILSQQRFPALFLKLCCICSSSPVGFCGENPPLN